MNQLCEEAIRLGIKAAKRDYNRPDQTHKLRGAIAGFERCRKIPPFLERYEAELVARHAVETEMHRNRVPVEEYWEHRCFTAEIEWMYEILKCAYQRYPLSCRAAMTYQRIVTGA